MNTFGTIFRVTDFGESHGPAIGGVVDGIPAGIEVDYELLCDWMRRRRPGSSPLVTARNEADEVRFLSGIYDGRTLGTPIGFIIENTDAHTKSYDNLADAFRPGHADYTYHAKYGIRDHRGGGRASARETAVRVAAGALAMMVLKQKGISISARPVQIGATTDASLFEQVILDAKRKSDTLGGIVECVVKGVPPGIGEPIFGKLQSRIAAAMMSINAAKGFEYGQGFDVSRPGSEYVDNFVVKDGAISFDANHSGGILGGISTGNDIVFRVAFKPIATRTGKLATINTNGERVEIEVKGRHDVCVVPRAVVVVEAMAAMTILDALMLDTARRL